MLANPLLDFDRLLLVKRTPLGLPQNWQGNTSIGKTGYDNEIAVLSPVRPDGKLTTLFKPQDSAFVGDVDLHFDGQRMLFSMPVKGTWQVCEIKADGSELRQLTPDIPKIDHYDGCYLPDGKIPLQLDDEHSWGALRRRRRQGRQSLPHGRRWYQRANVVLRAGPGLVSARADDGRVMYSRWEYSDMPHYHSRLLMSMNPDGTGQLSLYGSNSWWPNSPFYARQVP